VSPLSFMGWLQLVGSIKLQVSFAKEPYKRDDILQKRPVILSILLTVATPYVLHHRLNMRIRINMCIRINMYVSINICVRVNMCIRLDVLYSHLRLSPNSPRLTTTHPKEPYKRDRILQKRHIILYSHLRLSPNSS